MLFSCNKGGESVGIAAGIDKAIAVIAPQAALKRTVARQKMQILDSGYGNYDAGAIIAIPTV